MKMQLPTFDLAFVMRAADFAAGKHASQRRKGPNQEPYVNHLIEVVHHLSCSSGNHDCVLLAAGFLHDTIEDTDTTGPELIGRFGHEVAAVVAEVTDDKNLRSDVRKRLQIEKITAKSHRAQLLSIADKTANVTSLIHAAPADWSAARIADYGTWAEAVVSQISGIDSYLTDAFQQSLTQLRRRS
jgi:(p)ppGpp synthase/HD superfamily hydrolase